MGSSLVLTVSTPLSFQKSSAQAFVKSAAWARNKGGPPPAPLTRRFMVAVTYPFGTLSNGWLPGSQHIVQSSTPSDGYLVWAFSNAAEDLSSGYTASVFSNSFNDGTVSTSSNQLLPYYMPDFVTQASNTSSNYVPGSGPAGAYPPADDFTPPVDTVVINVDSYSITYPGGFFNVINGTQIWGGISTGQYSAKIFYADVVAQAAAIANPIASGNPGQIFTDTASGTKMILGYNKTLPSEYMLYAQNLVPQGLVYDSNGQSFWRQTNPTPNQPFFVLAGPNENPSWTISNFVVLGITPSPPSLSMAKIVDNTATPLSAHKFGTTAFGPGSILVQLFNGKPGQPVTLFMGYPVVGGISLAPVASGLYCSSFYNLGIVAVNGTDINYVSQGVIPFTIAAAYASNVQVAVSSPINFSHYQIPMPPVGTGPGGAPVTFIKTVAAQTGIYRSTDPPTYGYIIPVGAF